MAAPGPDPELERNQECFINLFVKCRNSSECDVLAWLSECYRECGRLTINPLPPSHSFEQFFQEHTTVRRFSEEERASIQLCVEQVALIASDHGYKIELSWLTALLDHGG